MNPLKTYLAELAACHQAAARAILELYEQSDIQATPLPDGVRLLWQGAHLLHQEFGSAAETPQPRGDWMEPVRLSRLCRLAYEEKRGRS